jgi:hypothetical protein
MTIIFLSHGILVANQLETRIESFPSCGPVATYAFLATVGCQPTIRDVEAMFREVNPSIDIARVSLWGIREVLTRFGVSTVAIRQPSKQLAKMQTPAILFVRGQQRPLPASDEVGHFVLLTSVETDDVEVIDWSQITGPERRRILIDQLIAEWGGEGIVLEYPAMSVAWVMKSATWFVVLTSLVWWLWLKLKNTKDRGHLTSPKAFLLLALLASSGCERAESPRPSDNPPIRFEKPSVNLGKIATSQSIRAEFAFKVCMDQSVKITEVVPCCGTLFVTKDLIGQTLAPGSQHKIEFEANALPGDAQPRTSFARIATEPRSLIPLIVAFTYFPIGSPRPLVKEIVVKARPHESCETNVTTVGWRLPTDSVVRLVREKCACSDFKIIGVQERSESVKTDEHSSELSQQDIQTIQLRSRRVFDPGEHRSLLHLTWDDNSTTDVVLFVKVVPPIHPAIDRLFLGVLSQGEEWARSIPIIQEQQTSLSFASAKCSLTFMTASVSSDGRTLEVRLTAPPVAGRIEGDIELRLQPGDWPVIRIPVTGIVK